MEPQGLRRESRAGLRFITVICPAHNEASSIGEVCRDVLALDMDLRLIVVDDGSSDGTGRIAQDAGAEVIAHRTNQGNGAAIKSGLAATRSEFAVIIDGDGQHDPKAIPRLVEDLRQGAGLVVAARQGFEHSGWFRSIGNRLLNLLASYMTRTHIPDLTSGFRAFRVEIMRRYLPLFPEGFSTPTTSTLAFLHSGERVHFEPIASRRRRHGISRTCLLLDALLFLTIAIRVTTLFNPRRALIPVLVMGGVVALASLLHSRVLPLDFVPHVLTDSPIFVFALGLAALVAVLRIGAPGPSGE